MRPVETPCMALISFCWFMSNVIFFCLYQHTTREKLDIWCVLNRFLAKIDGFQWFRIDSLILDILEFWSCLSSYRNVTKKKMFKHMYSLMSHYFMAEKCYMVLKESPSIHLFKTSLLSQHFYQVGYRLFYFPKPLRF